MSNPESNDRLDRVEAILERVGEKLESNARTIEALTELYEAMVKLATAQAAWLQRLEEVDAHQDQLSQRQGEIVEILQLLTAEKHKLN